MHHFLPQFLDEYFRRHPVALFLCLMILAAACCVLLLVQSGKPMVLYEGF